MERVCKLLLGSKTKPLLSKHSVKFKGQIWAEMAMVVEAISTGGQTES